MRGEDGSSTVELALLLPLIVILVLAVAEVAVAGRAQLEVVNSAREGARIAAVDPEVSGAVDAVKQVLGERGSDARVSVSRPQVVGESATVTVSVRHPVAPFIFGGSHIELRASASMRVER